MSTVEADRSDKMAGLPRDFDEWVTSQRMEHETNAQWRVRETFFKHYREEFTRDRLTVLSMCLVNVVFLGNSYGKGLDEKVGCIREKLEAHIAEAMRPGAAEMEPDHPKVTILKKTPPTRLKILTADKIPTRVDQQTMASMKMNPPPQISSTIPSALQHVTQVTRIHSVTKRNIVFVPKCGAVDVSKPPPPVIVVSPTPAKRVRIEPGSRGVKRSMSAIAHSSTYAEKLVEGRAKKDAGREDLVKSFRQKIQTRRSGGDGDKKDADNDADCAAGKVGDDVKRG